MKSTIASLAFFFAKTAYATDCAVDPVVTDPCFVGNPTCVTAFTDYLAAGGIFKGANTDAIRAAGGAAYADCLDTWPMCTVPWTACASVWSPIMDVNYGLGQSACKTAYEAWDTDGNLDCRGTGCVGKVKDQDPKDAQNTAFYDAIGATGAVGATVVECYNACPQDKSRDFKTVEDTCKADTDCKAALDKITTKDNAGIYATGCCENTKCKALVTCHFDPAVVPCTAPPPATATSAGVASTAGGAAALIVAALASLA